jgi:hypothetical protein
VPNNSEKRRDHFQLYRDFDMTPEELRLECLKLVQHTANASGVLLEPGQIISRARLYADFVINWGGNSGAGNVDAPQNLEMALPEGLRGHAPPTAQFQSGADNRGMHEAADAE